MNRISGKTTRSRIAAAAAGVVAGSAVLAMPTAPADAGPSVGIRSASASIAGASSTAGGFGLPQGSLTSTAPQSSLSAADSTGSTGNCAGYATNVGAGIYCYGGESSGTPLDLIDRFPGLSFDECRIYDVPLGMKAPHNPTPEKGKYYLQACLKDVNLHDPYGGDPRVTLSFVYVDHDEPDPTEWDPNPLEEYLWALVRSNYPVPFVTPLPTHIPRVGTPTWFQFRWLDENLEAATQGPYAGKEDGGPYLELNYGGVRLRAESERVRIVPQIEDMEPAYCGRVPKPYNWDAEPTLEGQDNSCWLVFEHSSAAAEELSTVELPPEDPDYPIPMYVINIEVDWHVTMEGDGPGDDLGVHRFTAYQQIPVSEVTGLVGQEL
jgi:hypothetical protein